MLVQGFSALLETVGSQNAFDPSETQLWCASPNHLRHFLDICPPRTDGQREDAGNKR